MTLEEVMTTLESLGSEQTRKIYKRHGSGDNLFGVKFGDLKPLAKKIGPNHKLAMKLWDTQNTDAQSLALLIAEPQKLTNEEAIHLAEHSKYYMVASMIAGVISHSPFATDKMYTYMKKEDEYIRQIGYNILSDILKSDYENQTETISAEECQSILQTIENKIHSSANRARHAMNGAVIAIAVYKHSLTDEAIEAAKRIGKVEVDHGKTSCKTPDAIPYIKKCLAHQQKKKSSA